MCSTEAALRPTPGRQQAVHQPAAAVETLPTGVGRSRWPRDWRRHMQTWCPPPPAALLAAGPGPVAPIKCSAKSGLGVRLTSWVWRQGFLH